MNKQCIIAWFGLAFFAFPSFAQTQNPDLGKVWLYTLASVVLVSLISLLGLFLLTINKNLLRRILLFLVSFAAGALLGDAFIHILPQMTQNYGFTIASSVYIILGMMFFFVLEKTEGLPFNFAIAGAGNSDHAYRYFFKLADQEPVIIKGILEDPERQSVTDQLFVICETFPCSPLGESSNDVAGFGRGEIVDEWDVSVIKVYKLRHYTGQ